jgi:hypothetical protein
MLQNLSHRVNESIATEIASANETLDRLGLLNGSSPRSAASVSATAVSAPRHQTSVTEGRAPRLSDFEAEE